MQRKRGLEIGRPFAFPILLHRSWIPASLLLVAHLSITAFGGRDLLSAIVMAATTLVGFFLSVAAHVFGEALISRALRIRIADSVLYVFGGVPRLMTHARVPAAEIVAALMGPLVSAALGAAALLAGPPGTGWVAELVRTLGMMNLALAAVNLLPGLPLDGGRIYAAVVWARTRDRVTGVRRAARAGQLIGLLAIACGVWLLLGGGVLDDTAVGSWLVITGFFVAAKATNILGSSSLMGTLEGRTAESWAKPFVGRLKADATVPTQGGPYAVAEDGRLAGILLSATTATRSGQHVRDVMVPWTSAISIKSSEPLERALEQLAQQPGRVLVVLDDDGIVRGVLDDQSVRANLGAG